MGSEMCIRDRYYTTMEFGELLKALLLDLQSLFRFQVSNPDLTLPQILLLSTISDEGTDMSSLSKQMGVDNSTMTRLIDVLIRNGWAIKYKDKTDGRVVMVEITKGGDCLLYTSPSPRDLSTSRMPSSA